MNGSNLAEWIVAPIVVGALIALGWLAFTKPKRFTTFAPRMLLVLSVPFGFALFVLSLTFVMEVQSLLRALSEYEPGGSTSYLLELIRVYEGRVDDSLGYLYWVLGGAGGFLLYIGALVLFTVLLHPEIYGNPFVTRTTITTHADGRVTVHQGPAPFANTPTDSPPPS